MRHAPRTLFPLLAAALLLAPPTVGATEVLHQYFFNGRFDLGTLGWRLGPGTSVGDGDYDGDNEAILTGATDKTRLATDLTTNAPATQRLVFKVERGVLNGASLTLILLDSRDPEAYLNNLGGEHGDDAVLAWSFASLGVGYYLLDPVDADFPAAPGWGSMTVDERRALLASYHYGSFALGASGVSPVGTLVDLFGAVYEV